MKEQNRYNISLFDMETLARTIWGEARGEKDEAEKGGFSFHRRIPSFGKQDAVAVA